MSFERYRAQVCFESFFGCQNFEAFVNISPEEIEKFVIDKNQAFSLSNSLKLDACDFYFKGCQSLTESLMNHSQRLFSWAIIKGYYSVFYMIKADFALRDFALIRHRCIYYLKATETHSPITKGRKGSNRANYSGDHKSALNYYKDMFSGSDILLSQQIDEMSAYQWLMKKREQINYQERNFREPYYPEFLEHINKRIVSNEFLNLIEEVKSDDKYLLTFQPEYAPIAIPLKRAMLTKKKFLDLGIPNILQAEQIEHLNKFLPFSFL